MLVESVVECSEAFDRCMAMEVQTDGVPVYLVAIDNLPLVMEVEKVRVVNRTSRVVVPENTSPHARESSEDVWKMFRKCSENC